MFFMTHKWQNWLVQRVLTNGRLFINFLFGARIVTGKESTMFIRSDIQINVKYIFVNIQKKHKGIAWRIRKLVISAKF